MSKNYRKLTDQIISLVGGKENIKSVTNCATRLRFYLADEEKAKTEELKKTDGIAGVVKKWWTISGDHRARCGSCDGRNQEDWWHQGGRRSRSNP